MHRYAPHVFYLDLNMYGNKDNFKTYYIILDLLCNLKNEHFCLLGKVFFL